MPELPEVEIVRRGLEAAMTGKRFIRVEQRRRDLRFPFPDRFATRLQGCCVERLERRAKYLLAYLSSGEVLLMHLGMTGRFTAARKGEKLARPIGDYEYDTGADPCHDHVVFHLEGGGTVTYNDPRRFGFMRLIPAEELAAHALMRHIGPEPLGNMFSAPYVAEVASGRRVNLKAFLMDQSVVAGLGNIYVCEALFRAGMSPKRNASSLASARRAAVERRERLLIEIRAVLSEAIAAGGSTLNDYRKADGSSGTFQEAHRVYDREGEKCVRAGCGGTIRRIVQGGRSTFYCPKCQK